MATEQRPSTEFRGLSRALPGGRGAQLGATFIKGTHQCGEADLVETAGEGREGLMKRM